MRTIFTVLLLALALAACTTEPQVSSQTYHSTQNQLAGNPNIRVWVNTASGVYHCPGTRWYGATKRGEYMTQREALQKGNRPAYGRYCQ